METRMSNPSAPAELPGLRPLYLPDVEAHPQPGVYKTLIDAAKQANQNQEYSKIWHLFAFQEDFTLHLARFTQGVLRKPSTLSPGLRELIAAYTSFQNECRFCANSHAAAAAELLGDEALVWTVLRDLDGSSLPENEKQLLRFVRKMTLDLPGIAAADVDALQAAGWDDEAIYYTITTCALFNFYNRWITATGVPAMSEAAHARQGKTLASRGYVRD
jgi:uncharacterized peroxidase-related enzyme